MMAHPHFVCGYQGLPTPTAAVLAASDYMQEVTPKVVAMAVSTVMMMLRIFPQMFLFSIVLFCFES